MSIPYQLALFLSRSFPTTLTFFVATFTSSLSCFSACFVIISLSLTLSLSLIKSTFSISLFFSISHFFTPPHLLRIISFFHSIMVPILFAPSSPMWQKVAWSMNIENPLLPQVLSTHPRLAPNSYVWEFIIDVYIPDSVLTIVSRRGVVPWTPWGDGRQYTQRTLKYSLAWWLWWWSWWYLSWVC